jgi:hypothetical protein
MATNEIKLGINLRQNKNTKNSGYGKYYPEVDVQETLSLKAEGGSASSDSGTTPGGSTPGGNGGTPTGQGNNGSGNEGGGGSDGLDMGG